MVSKNTPYLTSILECIGQGEVPKQTVLMKGCANGMTTGKVIVLKKKQLARILREITGKPARTICRTLKTSVIIKQILDHQNGEGN